MGFFHCTSEVQWRCNGARRLGWKVFMCVGLPARIVEIRNKRAKVKQGDHFHWVGLPLLEKIKVGDYLLIYQGVAINKLSPKNAKAILALIGE